MNEKTLEPTPTAPPEAESTPALGESALLTDEEIAASRDAALVDWDRKSDLWLFGYGSLIWNPGLPTLEAVRGKVHGYHRGLYLWSRVNRGTPEQPGLVLALDRGGSCTGMAFRLASADAAEHLQVLWRREMAMASYRPAWLPCTLADGRHVTALAFVMRREAASYTGKLSDPVVRTVFGWCSATRAAATARRSITSAARSRRCAKAACRTARSRRF